MAIPLDRKQIVPFEELLMSQVVRKKHSSVYLWRKEFSPKRVIGDGKTGRSRDEKQKGQTMTAYYEEIMELWKAGKFFDGINYFGQWMSKGLLTQEEIGGLSKTLPQFRELIEVECEKNMKVMFCLYEMVKNARNWDDKTLCKELKISKKTIEDIKGHRKPRFKAVGLRMLCELFPQMAV